MSSNILNFEYNNGWERRGCVATQPLAEKSESDPNWQEERAESLRRGIIAPAKQEQAKE